jgi:hypothetical protein
MISRRLPTLEAPFAMDVSVEGSATCSGPVHRAYRVKPPKQRLPDPSKVLRTTSSEFDHHVHPLGRIVDRIAFSLTF